MTYSGLTEETLHPYYTKARPIVSGALHQAAEYMFIVYHRSGYVFNSHSPNVQYVYPATHIL